MSFSTFTCTWCLSGSVFWSASYFAGSCGGAPLSTVKDYIDNQKRPA